MLAKDIKSRTDSDFQLTQQIIVTMVFQKALIRMTPQTKVNSNAIAFTVAVIYNGYFQALLMTITNSGIAWHH